MEGGVPVKKEEFKSLNSLRFFFIVIVVISHVGTFFAYPYSFFDPIYKFGGYLCNYFFFMLSGFLSAYSYHLKKDNKTSFAEFMWKKIKKYYPLYIITNLFIIVHCYLFINVRDFLRVKELIYNILMMSTGWIEDSYPYNYPCWFICVLLLCHVIFYFLMQIKNKNKDLYHLSLIGLICFGYILELKNLSIPFLYAHNGEGIFNFFMGVLLLEIYSILKDKLTSPKKINGISILFILSLIGLIFVGKRYDLETVMEDIRLVITVLIMPMVFFLALFFKPVIKVLEFPIFQYYGSLSMIIFFIHIPIQTIYGDVAELTNHLYLTHGNICIFIYLFLVLISSVLVSMIMKYFQNRKKDDS